MAVFAVNVLYYIKFGCAKVLSLKQCNDIVVVVWCM